MILLSTWVSAAKLTTISNCSLSKIEKISKIADVVQSICYIVIPASIIFFGIWYFTDLLTALYIIIPLSVIAVMVGLSLKYVINKFNNKLDKINSKFEKSITDNYKSINSFFDKDYIYNVMNQNKDNQ